MSSVIKALDLLVEYPHLQAYIKGFNGPHGFMFTSETETHERACQKQLGELLDHNCMHSGGSWGSLLRNIQAVLNGVMTREYVLEKAAEEKAHIQKMMADQAEADQAEAQEVDQSE